MVFGPQDVFEAGRMAFCQDPQGAFFAIWQAKEHIGARIKQEAGAMFWHELLTTDQRAALDFYVAALGVERGPVMEQNQYHMLNAGGTEVAGVMQITPDMGEFPPHWSVYFGVENADESVAKAQSLGATVFVPATDIVPFEGQPPIGRFSRHGGPAGRGLQHLPALGRGPAALAESATLTCDCPLGQAGRSIPFLRFTACSRGGFETRPYTMTNSKS